ncbi:hypothetical protein [Paenibacillus chitinolyticus]|uniref:hypothetical protein n=1 Tax=Paenibacillus chitinolyticus TaxID=79263 RepID=UPI001C44E7E7|nr:hypothetical protein [Paenibacillus chitinolyticus]MBV6717182.1 hypothetical protein [Paenibacillus chitinolyticus]
MRDDELDQVLRDATELAHKKAKAAGTSLTYEENGKMIREYADGRKMQVIIDDQGKRTEIEYRK